MEELAKKYSQHGWFLRINRDWINSLYGDDKNYSRCLIALDMMYRNASSSDNGGGGGGGGGGHYSNNNHGNSSIDYFLREKVHSVVQDASSSSSQSQSSLYHNHNSAATTMITPSKKPVRLDVFPGPMATQLCRRHLPLLSVCLMMCVHTVYIDQSRTGCPVVTLVAFWPHP